MNRVDTLLATVVLGSVAFINDFSREVCTAFITGAQDTSEPL